MKSQKLFAALTIITGTILFVSGFLFISGRIPDSGRVGIKQRYAGSMPEAISSADKNTGNQAFNILLIGGDWIYKNSDTIMLINYNPKNNSVNLLSIPRDTKVIIEGRDRKLNFAFPRGGSELAVSTVEALTGAQIKYRVMLDTAAFKKIVDLFGGIYFNVPRNMKYSDPTQNLRINLSKGWQFLDGNKAEQLVRYRAGYEDGDLTRIQVQQAFIKEFVRQKINVRNLHKLAEAVEIVFDSIETDLPLSEALELLTHAAEIKADDINTFVLPGTQSPGKSIWYYIADEKETSKLINAHFSTD